METRFRIHTKKSMGNLHLQLEGIFDGGSAMALTAALHEHHAKCNRLFINTEKLERIEPIGTTVLQAFMRQFPGVSERVYYKGKNGKHMALDGQRVLRVKPLQGCGCSGKCTVCRCAERKKQRDAATSGKES
jgi:hypothetical protein